MGDRNPLCFFDLYSSLLVEASIGLIGVVGKDVDIAFLVDIDLAGIVLHLHFNLGLHPNQFIFVIIVGFDYTVSQIMPVPVEMDFMIEYLGE